MQMTEDLIRNVVQEVLSQMGGGGAVNGKASARSAGNLGVFPSVDTAVAAAEAAFDQFRHRPLADRKKAVACVRKICVDQAEELGRAELAETKIGRVDHKIAKLNQTIPLHPWRRVPSHRQRQRRRRPDPDGLHPVRRHRSHHTGDS